MRSIGDAVIATDEHGVVTMTNPVAEKLTGWPLDEAVGKPLEQVFRIVNEDTRAVVESPVSKVLREGGIVGLANHTVLIRRDEHETAIEDSGAPILDDTGRTTGVVLVFRDATQERAAKKALHDADRRKDEFLATLAHELRNPLAPILQAAGTAAHRFGQARNRCSWSLGVIQRQVAHMARLLDDLLDVSRITRGRLEVRRERVGSKTIVDTAIEIAQPAINAGKHQLSVELPAEPLELEVDSLRIAQVLGNLLTNAAKYTPPEGRIRLTAERVNDAVLVRVIDNGIGLEAADLPRIFEMFTQVSPSADRPNSGLGIGLALSKASHRAAWRFDRSEECRARVKAASSSCACRAMPSAASRVASQSGGCARSNFSKASSAANAASSSLARSRKSALSIFGWIRTPLLETRVFGPGLYSTSWMSMTGVSICSGSAGCGGGSSAETDRVAASPYIDSVGARSRAGISVRRTAL